MAPQTAPVGLSFTETMKGFLKKGAAPAAQEDIAAYVAAERAGQQVNSYLEFTLTIAMANLDAIHGDPRRARPHRRSDGVRDPAHPGHRFHAATRHVRDLRHRRSGAQGDGTPTVWPYVHGHAVGRVRAFAALAVVPTGAREH